MSSHTAISRFAMPVNEIAEAHATMQGLVRDALHALQRGDATALQDALSSLLGVTRAHFQTEEALMRETAYPHAFEHTGSHQQLLHGLVKLQRVQVSADKTPSFVQTLGTFIDSWFSIHLERDDAAFAAFLHERERIRLPFGGATLS